MLIATNNQLVYCPAKTLIIPLLCNDIKTVYRPHVSRMWKNSTLLIPLVKKLFVILTIQILSYANRNKVPGMRTSV